MSATGKLDRPGGSLYFAELLLFPDARHGLPCSHGAACGRALRAFLDRRAA